MFIACSFSPSHCLSITLSCLVSRNSNWLRSHDNSIAFHLKLSNGSIEVDAENWYHHTNEHDLFTYLYQRNNENSDYPNFVIQPNVIFLIIIFVTSDLRFQDNHPFVLNARDSVRCAQCCIDLFYLLFFF